MPEELPAIELTHGAAQFETTVEGRDRTPQAQLVPDLKVPEPTREERIALGERPLDYKFLLYNLPFYTSGSRVGTWYAGVRTGTAGYAFPSILYNGRTSISGIAGFGGPVTATDPTPARVSMVGPTRDSAGVAGPRTTITVGTDPQASQIAERKPRIGQ
jgi:hypothetical protein